MNPPTSNAQVAAGPQGDDALRANNRFTASLCDAVAGHESTPEWNICDCDTATLILPFNVKQSVALAVAFQLNLEWRRQTSEPF